MTHEDGMNLLAFPNARAADAALDSHAALIPLLHLVLSRREGEFSTLCEVGCGSGRLLRESTERFPQLNGYVGLNVDRAQTSRNRTVHRELPIRFEFECPCWTGCRYTRSPELPTSPMRRN